MAFFLASLKAFPLANETWSVLLVRSNEIPFKIMPLTAATPSMIFPRVVVLVPTMGTVTVRLSLAICPTTVEAPLANEVLGQTLREEAWQLLLVSPLAVSTPTTQLTCLVSQATAALTVLPPTVTCRLIVAVSGAACTVADPQTVIVLSVQQTCVPAVCRQVLRGEPNVICAYPAASKIPKRNTFGTVMIRLQMEKLVSNIRGIEIIIINKRYSSQFALMHLWSPAHKVLEVPAGRGSIWRSQNRKERSYLHSGRLFFSLTLSISH